MAFDNADTDEWYESALVPALKWLHVNVRRVDRIEHNDDIDDRIMTELYAADFVIADLTYARPSVYFEAGFAQRAVPVIYTVRADHFAPDRTHPDLRVHFDLAMKNIISWKAPGDPTFGPRLKKRVELVTAPLLKAIAHAELAKTDRAEFASLSLLAKVETASDVIAATIRGARLVKLDEDVSGQVPLRRPMLTGSAFRSGVLFGFQAVVEESVTLATLKRQMQTGMSYPAYNIQLPTAADRLERIADIFVIGAVGAVPISRITNALKFFEVVDSRAKHLRWSGDEDWPGERVGGFRRVQPVGGYVGRFKATRRNGDLVSLMPIEERGIVAGAGASAPIVNVPRTLDVVVIDQINSSQDLSERLGAALDRWQASAPKARSLT